VSKYNDDYTEVDIMNRNNRIKFWTMAMVFCIASVLMLTGCVDTSPKAAYIQGPVFFMTQAGTSDTYQLVMQFYVLDEDYNKIISDGEAWVRIIDEYGNVIFSGAKEVSVYPKQQLLTGEIAPAHEITIHFDELELDRNWGNYVYGYMTYRTKDLVFDEVRMGLI